MKKGLFVLFLILLWNKHLLSMTVTSTKPATDFPKAHCENPGITMFEIQATRSNAISSYNDKAQVVPLLSPYGPEDLLARFVNPNLPFNDETIVGRALFSGVMKKYGYVFSFAKNFNNNVFFEATTTFVSMNFNDIKIIPVWNACMPMTPYQLDKNTELKEYLIKLEEILLPCGVNTLYSAQSLGQSLFLVGWIKTFQDFARIDFIDLSVLAGISIPEIFISGIKPSNAFFHAPTNVILNIGVPMQASFALGAYDWFTCGATFIISPFFKNDHFIAVNPSNTHNHLLLNNYQTVRVNHKAFLYTNAFIEAEHLIPKTTILFGLSFAKQFNTIYSSFDQHNFPDGNINKSAGHKPWSILNMTFEVEYDFAHEKNKNLPIIKMTCTWPIVGEQVFKTKAIGGAFLLELAKQF